MLEKNVNGDKKTSNVVKSSMVLKFNRINFLAKRKYPTTFPRCLHPCYRGCVAIGPARGRRSRGWAVTWGRYPPGNEKTYPTDGKGKNIFPANFNGDMLVPWRAFILLLLFVLLVSNSFEYFFFAALLILLAFIRSTPCTFCLFFYSF